MSADDSLLADLLAGRIPDAAGRFGPYGGRFVPETLMGAVTRLEEGVRRLMESDGFERRPTDELESWVGRPTALTRARSLGHAWGIELFGFE